jgi:AcrR family transcriptional regulator
VAATLRLLAQRGYDGMSIDAIAKTAGVGKPSIYRRWKDKADIATAALAQFQMREPRVDPGPARRRLIAHLRAFRASLLRPLGMSMLGTILAEEHRTPELLRLFRERIVATRRRRLRQLLEEGMASGEVRSDADLDAAINAMIGSFYARYLSGEPIPPQWADRIVGVVWPALAR